MAMGKETKAKFDAIDLEIAKFNTLHAQCRGAIQTEDHDKLIALSGMVNANIANIAECKKLNTKAHDEIKQECKEAREELKGVDKEILDKLETATGNLNQAMSFITDMQRHGRLKVGIWTTIISGALATVLAAFIIWVGTLVYSSVKKDDTAVKTEEVLMEISKQLQENSKYIKKVEETIKNQPIDVIIEEKTK